MDDRNVEIFATVLPPLVQALQALAFIARHMHPPEIADVLEALLDPDAELRAIHGQLQQLPPELSNVRSRLVAASDCALQSFDELRAALQQGDLRAAMRAPRHALLADEALYPLAAAMPVIDAYFLPDDTPADAGRTQASAAGVPGATGIVRGGGDAERRGDYALYVPEHGAPDVAAPLVMALHGGSGNGRSFLWSWLRHARQAGAILVAPTAIGRTWALTGDDADSANLVRILREVQARRTVDATRMLLTGLSDGGTFCYVSGLTETSPFTHLAPVAAAFHPVLAQMAHRGRLDGLPIHITHGARDWMFPVEMARGARTALQAAGANVSYSEIEDLSHCYPREINADLLGWMAATPAKGAPRG